MNWTDRELTGWLDALLPSARITELEEQLRTDEELQSRVAQLIHHRDQGGHTVGEIWQRAGLSCPARAELGGYLLGTLSAEAAAYIRFHLDVVGCRICNANLADLRQHTEQVDDAPERRQRFFESSAGLLRLTNDEREKFSE